MGTRSGDMDPAVPLHMMNTLCMSAKEMDTGRDLEHAAASSVPIVYAFDSALLLRDEPRKPVVSSAAPAHIAVCCGHVHLVPFMLQLCVLC